MFKEIVERQQAEFFARQTALIEARGGNFKSLIDGIPKLPGVNFGEPPYIVDDGGDALLLIDADGNYFRLPPNFNLSEEVINRSYDSLYSVPSLSTGFVVRLIPANGHYDFPKVQVTSHEFDDTYYAHIDELFEHYMNSVIELTRETVADRLPAMKTLLMHACAEHDVPVEKFLRGHTHANAMCSLFSQLSKSASDEVSSWLGNDEENCEEDDDQS